MLYLKMNLTYEGNKVIPRKLSKLADPDSACCARIYFLMFTTLCLFAREPLQLLRENYKQFMVYRKKNEWTGSLPIQSLVKELGCLHLHLMVPAQED